MSARIYRFFERLSQWPTLARRGFVRSKSCRTKDERLQSLGFEELETRRLLVANVIADFGSLGNDRSFGFVENAVEGTTVPGVNERFIFSLGQSAVVHASASGLERFNLLEPAEGELVISSLDEVDEEGEFVTFASQTIFESSTSELVVSLPPGEYAADFFRDGVKQFDFAIHADRAPGEVTSGSLNPSATVGRNLGTLLTANGVQVVEHIGLRASPFDLLFGSTASLTDLVDTHFFQVIKQGRVEFTIETGVINSGSIDVTLFRDFNNDGLFQRGTAEEIVTKTGLNANKLRGRLSRPPTFMVKKSRMM